MADNGSKIAKTKLRRWVFELVGPAATVLEAFAGEGGMYRALWSEARRGLTMDKDPVKVRDASKERQNWAVYKADSERALWAGIGGDFPYDIVDIDAYGSPWPFVRTWFESERLRANPTWLILTDGYMRRASLAAPCRALVPDKKIKKQDMPANVYKQHAEARLNEWCANAGLKYEWVRSVADKRMVLHLLKITPLSNK